MVTLYRGSHYGQTESLSFGLSILVLGESTYMPDKGRGESLPTDRNEQIINCVFRHERDLTMTRAVGVFYGKWRSWDQRCDFWRGCCFANFVQFNMGQIRMRPDESQWMSGVQPFWEYLNSSRPQFVLALD